MPTSHMAPGSIPAKIQGQIISDLFRADFALSVTNNEQRFRIFDSSRVTHFIRRAATHSQEQSKTAKKSSPGHSRGTTPPNSNQLDALVRFRFNRAFQDAVVIMYSYFALLQPKAAVDLVDQTISVYCLLLRVLIKSKEGLIMIKPVSAIISGILLTAAMSAQADRRTGGEDAYYIDSRGPISNNVVVDWMDSKAKGGDAYNGPVITSSNFKVYYVAPEPKGGDNK